MLKAAAMPRALSKELAQTIPGFGLALTLQPITAEHLHASAESHGNFLGLSASGGPLVNLLLVSIHANKEDDEKLITVMNGFLARLNELAEEMDVPHRYRFMNYSYKGFPVIES